jgi:hypothetical protein
MILLLFLLFFVCAEGSLLDYKVYEKNITICTKERRYDHYALSVILNTEKAINIRVASFTPFHILFRTKEKVIRDYPFYSKDISHLLYYNHFIIPATQFDVVSLSPIGIMISIELSILHINPKYFNTTLLEL